MISVYQLMVLLILLPNAALGQRQVNVPYFSGGIDPAACAIFWFGQVDNTRNHAMVRAGFNNEGLVIHVHVVDRFLWYDRTPATSDLTSWDAVTVYLDTSGAAGTALTERSYAFTAQLNGGEDRAAYQVSRRGNGSTWLLYPVPFTTRTGWRGNNLNEGTDARGWVASFTLPFTSLGLSAPPVTGGGWELGVAVHDRDNSLGTTIADQTWPETFAAARPETWGRLRFGLPVHTPATASPVGTTIIRQGLDGITVRDAHVGGHSNCGDPYGPSFFDGWGNANYSGYDQVNVQNQWDVADWPCFSRYYVTFPLGSVPPGKAIVSATLRLHFFGNAWGDPIPGRSLIQALVLSESWDEAIITWNNAPLAQENVSRTWVDTVPPGIPWPGVPYDWDVTQAAAEAYTVGLPLRLALFEADTQYHSGKYFSSSDTGSWNAVARPTLEVVWGEPSGTPPSSPRNLRIRP